MPGVRGLSKKQQKFCEGIMEGKDNYNAYKDAGYSTKGSYNVVKANAHHLKKNKYVQKELERLEALAEAGAILRREQRQAILTEWALDPNNDMPDRLRSMDQLNRMSGDYTDTVRTQVTGQVKMSLAEKLEAWDAAMNNETT